MTDSCFSWDRGFVSSGDEESLFLQILPEGIYRMDREGRTRPLVLWDECLLSVSGVTAENISLKFGDDGSQQYSKLLSDGAFDDYSSERIFENKNTRGMLA